MHLVFNELSLHDITMDKVKDISAFEEFLKTYSRAVKQDIGYSREIITPIDFNSIEISKGYYAIEWRNAKNIDRDLQTLFKRMCDLQKIQTYADSDSEVTYCNKVGIGLIIAYQDDYTVISINNNVKWNDYNLKCEYYSLDTDETIIIHLQNISSEQMIDDNLFEILDKLQNEKNLCFSVDELLKNIRTLFPSLLFHPNAINQIKTQLEKKHIPIVAKKLMQLEDYFVKWDGGKFERDHFPNQTVSPQSKETLRRFKTQHTFTFEDGNIVVSYHMRYTGNIPGRIYFYPDNDLKKARICSLTTKLPTVTNPKMKPN